MRFVTMVLARVGGVLLTPKRDLMIFCNLRNGLLLHIVRLPCSHTHDLTLRK